MKLQSIPFIQCPGTFHPELRSDDPAPRFRRRFTVRPGLLRATLTVCALGIGYIYLNGRPASDDLFTAPVSDYRKTLWYTAHDVTALLTPGENVAAAVLGNGMYNEALDTPWKTQHAAWRDAPKLLLRLTLHYPDGADEVISGTDWRCNAQDSPYRFNQLRAGEVYDARRPQDWMDPSFDDRSWGFAAEAARPAGTLRRCPAPPIREDGVYPCQSLTQNADGDWVFDFGQNLAGYVEIRTQQPAGTRLTVTFAELLYPDGTRNDNELPHYYYDRTGGVAELICGDAPICWKPQLSYYGFRYAIVRGFPAPPLPDALRAVFVHQDVRPLGEFHCADPMLNWFYRAARMATLSNLFYMPTDCPTREKLGWCNDAQASAEQFIQNYDMTGFYAKWTQDLIDAVAENGDLPGIVPTWGWGYHWGNGPVSTGVLFEVADRMFRATGDDALLRQAYPAMRHHLAFYRDKIDPDTGLVSYGLGDWAGPFPNREPTTPLPLVTSLVLVKLLRIATLAADRSGCPAEAAAYRAHGQALADRIIRVYLNESGRCTVHEQTAVAMLIALGVYRDLAPLAAQLRETVAQHDGHFFVGMVGMQYLFPALDRCGLEDLAYGMLTAHGFPSYRNWMDEGATTLWEYFSGVGSRNHHMYSCPVAWLHNTLLGIRLDLTAAEPLVLSPYFPPALPSAGGAYDTALGRISVEWTREGGRIRLRVGLPDGLTVPLRLRNAHLPDGAAECTVSGSETELVLRPN